MRNNVNNNGLINGGYTNNQNVNQILYFNQDVQPVQLTPSPYLTSQTFIGSPQQIPFQSIYNSIPNYYNMGVVNYPTQTTAIPYPPLIMKQNGYSTPIMSTRLDVVDPNTGNNISISRPTTPVATPKRRSTLQIIDPVSKNEIDVSKIVHEKNIVEEEEKDKKEFKFEFDIKNEDIINEESINKQENHLLIDEKIVETKIENDSVEPEVISEDLLKEDIEKKEIPEEKELKNILEEQELQIILHEIEQENDDDNDFTEVVSKKKKKQQTKMLIQEQKSQEVKTSLLKKENSRNPNGYKRDNRDRNVRNGKIVTNESKDELVSPNNSQEDKKNSNNQRSFQNGTDKDRGQHINRSGTRVFHNNDNENINSGRNEHHSNRNHHQQGHLSRNDNNAIDNVNENNKGNARIQRNESRNTCNQLNGNRNENFQRNENRNGSSQRNEIRNENIKRNESRNENIQRNESRNASIQRNESRNASIQRNESRNASIQRNESRNASIQRNESRNASIQRNESRNGSIQRNESRNASIQRNESRNENIQYNGNKNKGVTQRFESRNPSGQRTETRQSNGEVNETMEGQQLHNASGANIDNRSSTLPRTQNGPRNDYNRNRFNQRSENQNFNGQRNDNHYENRNRNNNNNNHGINRNYNRNDNYRSNNNNNNREDECVVTNSAGSSRRGSTESKPGEQEFKTPYNKTAVKQPLNFQRAFRKSSSPLFAARNIESEKPVEVSRLVENSEVLLPNDNSRDVVEQLSREMHKLEIDNADNRCVVSNSENVVAQPNSESSTMKESEMISLEEIIVSEQDTKSVVEACVDEVDASSVMEVEEIIPSDETETRDEVEDNKQLIEIDIVESETVAKTCEEEDSTQELEIKTGEIENELKMETEDGEIKTEVEVIGRLTYYRENLLALRGNQTLPDQIFLDPALIDVISAKMQLINFLKKKDIFFKSNTPKSDYLDFTRKHYNIRPKRLIRGDNGYLPPQLRKMTEDKMNLLKRNIKTILNKMTPENFDICMNDLVNLDIDEEENMRCLIDEIFSKAIQEESYSSIYAKFCAEMSNARVGNFTFKTLLLKSCQSMFDKPLHLQLEEVKVSWENKASNEKDEKMKKLYESEVEEQVKKAKDKYMGNIRFFSELFLTNQLSWKIIIACAEKLLTFSKDNNSLEAACKLIQICGKQLEILEKQRGSGDNKFSKVMTQFVALSNKMDIESRIRFKLKDIVDMRDRGWELRGIQKAIINVPKTLDEMKEDKLKEDNQKAKMNYNNNNNPRYRQPPPKSVMDTKRLMLNTQNVTENTVLGPSLRTQWNAGCQTKANNGFSTIPIRKQVVYDDIVEKPVVIKTQNKYAKFCDDEIDVEATPVASVPVDNDDVLTTELFNFIMNNIPVVDRWKELFNPVVVVEKWFALMFERKLECRIRIGDYFNDLIEQGSLTIDQLVQGAMSTLETIDDLLDDVPKFWEFLAEFLERFIKNENSNISFFHDLFKDVKQGGYETSVEKCLKFTKQFSSNRLSGDMVEDLFRKYQL